MPPGTNAGHHNAHNYFEHHSRRIDSNEEGCQSGSIEGTDLMQVQNSDNALFLCESDQHYYVLLSGRVV